RQGGTRRLCRCPDRATVHRAAGSAIARAAAPPSLRTRGSVRRPTPAHLSSRRRRRRSALSQARDSFSRSIAPPAELVIGAEGLLPTEDDQAGKQRERELPIEPTVRGDAVVLDRRTEPFDRRFFRHRYPRPVDREVPGELVAARALAGIRPVDEDG